MPPLNPDNGILREITKLKANFITTNYDENIEQNLKSQEEKNINTVFPYNFKKAIFFEIFLIISLILFDMLFRESIFQAFR